MIGSNADEILLVEDNDSDAELTMHALEKSRLVNMIVRVDDGEKALDFLFCRGSFADRQFTSPPRLILLDLKLPKVDGMQVLRQVKSDPGTKAIPVILLTASKEDRDVVESYQLGVNSYIQKPVNFSDFQDVVRQLGLYWLLVNIRPPRAAFSKS
ncbi:MAG: response regulator [Candidatus Acidiferrales bacterium]